MTRQTVASNAEWVKWGEVDPLYGVASWEGKAIDQAAPWTSEEFYELGRSDWEDFRRRWEEYGLHTASCLEIGCGAGRITKHLAKYFDLTHGIDVSDGMIAYSREHITDDSVVFHLTNGSVIPLEDESVSAVFSTHVIRHLESRDDASAYFREAARVLRPGGSMMINVLIYSWPTMDRLYDLIYGSTKRFENVNAALRRLMMSIGVSRPIMRRLSLPVHYFYDELPGYGLSDIEVSIIQTTSNKDPHPFVFARKTDSSHRTK